MACKQMQAVYARQGVTKTFRLRVCDLIQTFRLVLTHHFNKQRKSPAGK